MKNRKKVLRRTLGIVLALVLILPLAGPGVVVDSSAVTQAEIDALKGDANDLASQKKDIQEQLKGIQADKDNALAQKELLERQINVIQQEIKNIDQQIAMYDQLISEKAEELAQAEADEAAQFDLFCRRMRNMEEKGEDSYWAILFSSSSFADLLDNYMMIEEIIQYDNHVMDELVALQNKVSEEKAELEDAQAQQEAARERQVSAQDELKSQEAEVDKLIERIKNQEAELQAAEAELKKAADAVNAQIRAAERELASQISSVVSESGFMWPLASNLNRLTSLYAGRIDPISGKPDNHTGIDIAAAKGTPIYAAKSGVVTTSEYGSGSYWSYGNFVVISHSDGTSTLYAHMNSRNVSKGQVVNQGDVIGYVGTTGRVTGAHLHFEVRVNGVRTDPVNYFKDKTLYFGGVVLPH